MIGIDDHAAFTAFDAVDFFGLAFDRHVAVDETDAALLRERDGEVGFGDGIHRGADDGNVQRDLRVSLVRVSASAGRTSLRAGTRSTSSKVRPSGIA